ncbi:MAG: hypothetical protein ABI905_01345 [Betaproteobacteria bacterium]
MRTGVIGLLFALPVLYGGCEWWSGRPVTQSPGVLVSAEPLQAEVSTVPPLQKSGYQIRPLARYEIAARVLSTESYRWDAGADLVPVDVAVGWGRMSDTAVLKEIEIWQSGRWYQWRTKNMPIPHEEVTNHSANMHLIAADKYVAKKISALRDGQVVKMRGYLVEAKRSDGFTWTSSLSRTDSGNGACELMWVEDIGVE